MGFLKRQSGDEGSESPQNNEELYEKLFPKIGRDFIYKDDLYKIIEGLMLIIDPLGLTPIDFLLDIEARKKALEYKIVLESGRDGSKLYRDLINLDDD